MFSTAPKRKDTVEALWKISKVILNTLDFNSVVQQVVDSLLFELNYIQNGYRIIVLTLIDERTQTLKRISLSQTDEAKKALEASAIPFHEIEIPLSATDNILVRALAEKKPLVTNSWPDLFRPVLTDDQAITNQLAAGIKTSMIFPVINHDKPIGVLIFSMAKNTKDIPSKDMDILSGFTDLVGLAVQNAQLYTSLGKTTYNLQQATQELKVANVKLKELDKLKDDFVSIASHELRTPMTAIRSYVWMALHKSDIPLSQKLQRYLYRTLVSTERLINLVNDMLNISRIESGKLQISPTAFDPRKLVEDVFAEVDIKAKEKNIKLELVDFPNLPEAFADVDKIHQILLNLIGNALKFTPENGTISGQFFSDGKVVEVAIKDSGVGISKDEQGTLFTKFGRLESSYQSTSSSGGTGLGLFICKKLIYMMQGKIWATSEGVGKGTTVIFSLPIASKDVLAHPERYQVNPEGEVKGLEPVSI